MNRFTSVTDSSFDQHVINSDSPVLVYFWAEWCGECRPMTETVDVVSAEKHGRLKVVLLNVDENPRMTRLYCIQMIPTLVLFISGKERERIEGLTNRAHLSSTIEMHLQDEMNSQPDLGNIG